MKILKNTLFSIFILMFVLSISVLFITDTYREHDNSNYKSIQPESFVPDVIETVLHDPDLKQIYVCYNDANCVNVYTESGEFLWAVATPYLRNSYFELQEGKLIIYDGDAYIYNSENGEFLGLENADNLDLSYDWEDEETTEFEDSEFYFDFYQVYKADSEGNLHTIVSRPAWHWIFNPNIYFITALAGAIGIGVMIFLKKTSAYNSIKNNAKINNKKAIKTVKLLRISTIINLSYTVLNIAFSFFSGLLCIGIIPIAFYFIISNIFTSNLLERTNISNDEQKIIDFWNSLQWATFILAFFSVIIVAAILG